MASRDYTRERREIVGRSIHSLMRCELLIAIIVTLATVWAIADDCGWGWCGGWIYCAVGGLNEQSMVSTSGELYLVRISAMS